MKRTNIAFIPRRYAPRMQSRASGIHFATTAYKTDGGDGDGGDGDDDESAKKALLDQIQKQVEGIFTTRGIQDKAAVQAAIKEQMAQFDGLNLEGLRAMADPDKGIMAIARKQGEAIAELEKRFAAPNGQPMSVRAQVERWQDENKDALEKIKNGQRADLKPLEVRAAITMTEATSLGGSNFLPSVTVLPGVNDLVRNQPVFAQYFTRGRRASSATIIWVNKTNKQGNATFIGEGTIKALASFELSTESSNAKKVAERMKVSTEMLYDIDYLTALIEQELRYEVDMAVDAGLFNGVGTTVYLKGFTTYASAYSLTTVLTTTPNVADDILAAATQIRSLNFNPDLAFINTIDGANMQMAKSSTGEYILPPFMTSNGMNIGSIRVIETNNIPVGYIAVVDSSKYNVYDYLPYTVAWGWENDDFSKNLVTVIGERRLHAFMSTNNAGAIVYDTIANIRDLITAP